ncbi:PREDICTED: protein FAM135B-like isoform X2 [Nelumbo nucifera]|uniref:Protein FAM135B-like isoform X2 n=1 Tax=Nelumbo nucifera TaxID=4432 RepID=A0A1U7Z352_NELNU|nr:PREDICTED: protein FAM135B-like isoform X2 [Nelumbo nucifera]
MLRRFRLLIGLNQRSVTKKLLNANSRAVRPAMLEALQEVAVYIHRFHNLDLFQQGWYQIKISMRWEDGSYTSPGTPARVVQYEASEVGPDDILGGWRIDDTDNSFCTQPFRIKYARQDVLLSVMVSFIFSLYKCEGPSTSAVILKFELLYAPILEKGSDMQASLDAIPAAVHEFRLPPKALLGLHSYCPVIFDAFHAVLVDLSIHVVLKAGAHGSSQMVSSDYYSVGDVAGENCVGSNKALDQRDSVHSYQIAFLKELLVARDILLEELQKLSKAIDQTIDLTDVMSNLGDFKLISTYLQEDLSIVDAEDVTVTARHAAAMPQNGFEKPNHAIDEMLQSLSKDNLLSTFNSVGKQLSFLWNAFLKFHRDNKTKILEHLRDSWVNDRKAEWSIWMVYSKVEMPHHYVKSNGDETSQSVRGKVSLARKLSDDSAETAIARAELHRRSIAQMRINNRSIQDMHIFGDPLRIPVIIVERVLNTPRRTISGNSYFSVDQRDASNTVMGPMVKAVSNLSSAGPQKNVRVLRVVVFVHGFQGHHLDLRLVRNQWLLIDPRAECLMSEANEDKTSGDFREMGLRLAEEVTSFLRKKIDKMSRSGGFRTIKLSFVGHSIGNIIIRTALTETMMEPYLKYLYTYLSISGPHLGYLYSSNSLFNSGLWLLKKLKGSQCIHQLTFTDDPELHNTFFYKLCKQKTLENFKNIILLSSPQDGYVPYHSARIDLCQASSLDYSKKSRIFTEMLNNCLDQIRAPTSEQRIFMRCDVNFDTTSQGRNLNTFIGRAAHIEFLESDIFARFIMWSFQELFR